MATQDIGSFADTVGDFKDESVIAADKGAEEKAAQEAAAAKAAGDSQAASAKAAQEAENKAASAAAEKAKAAASTNANPNLAEKPEEKPAVEDDEKKPEGVTEKAWLSFKSKDAARKQAIKERDEAKQEAAAIRAELAESGKTKAERDELRKELESVKAKIGEQEQELNLSRIEGTAKFKSGVTAPRARITASLEEIAKRYDIPVKTFTDAIQESDPAKRADLITEAIADLKVSDQLKIGRAEESWQDTEALANEMRGNAASQLAEQEKHQKAQQDADFATVKKDYDSSFNQEFEKALNATPYVKKVSAQGLEGDALAQATGWNKMLDSLATDGLSLDPNAIDVADLAKMKVAEKMLPLVLDSLKHFDAELKKARAALAESEKRNKDYRSSAIGAGSGGAGGNGSSKSGAGLFADVVTGRE